RLETKISQAPGYREQRVGMAQSASERLFGLAVLSDTPPAVQKHRRLNRAMRKQIRAWTEAFETFVLEVNCGQRKGKWAALMRTGLYLLSKIFHALVKLRRFR